MTGPSVPGRSTGAVRRWWPWAAMLVVLAVTLAVGAWPRGEPSLARREAALAATMRCPTCRSQSVASSDAPGAKALRTEIAQRLRAGESEDQIRDFVVSKYGEGILLDPPNSGVAGLVWSIPVVAAVVAFAALAFRFRRWRPSGGAGVSAEDQALVDAARHRPATSGGPAAR